jgi:peptidoglycan-N-acetylglucosamine deacetylase
VRLSAACWLLGCALAGAPEAGRRRIAITIDDLPCAGPCNDDAEARAVTSALLGALDRAHAPAAGFVIGSKAGSRVGLLEQWLRAGMDLGNHTWSHADANRTPAAEYALDIDRASGLLAPLAAKHGARLVWFRFPFTHTGGSAANKAELERILLARGLRGAPFTVEHEDYLYNSALIAARARGDHEAARRVKTAYLSHLEALMPFAERVSGDLFGREIPQILLIHANRLNAECLETMLGLLGSRGYRFIRLEEALADDAYRTPDLYVDSDGPPWFHRWAIALSKPFPMRGEPAAPEWVRALAQ